LQLNESGGRRNRGQFQDFQQLRNHHAANGTLFEDDEFPAENSSLLFSKRPDRNYEWLRPMEIAENPQFFVEVN
jgi:calpain, invertebrate